MTVSVGPGSNQAAKLSVLTVLGFFTNARLLLPQPLPHLLVVILRNWK